MGTDKQNNTNKALSENPEFQEWKECRSSIARFDNAILDIRKYGFTLITILLTANGYIYSSLFKQNSPKTGAVIGIYLALMLLIVALFRVDRYHEVFLQAACAQAKLLEKQLGMSVSEKIGSYAMKCNTAHWAWAIWLYVSFCAANFVLALGAILEFGYGARFKNSVFENWIFIMFILAIGASAVIVIWVLHRSSKKAFDKLEGMRGNAGGNAGTG